MMMRRAPDDERADTTSDEMSGFGRDAAERRDDYATMRERCATMMFTITMTVYETR